MDRGDGIVVVRMHALVVGRDGLGGVRGDLTEGRAVMVFAPIHQPSVDVASVEPAVEDVVDVPPGGHGRAGDLGIAVVEELVHPSVRQLDERHDDRVVRESGLLPREEGKQVRQGLLVRFARVERIFEESVDHPDRSWRAAETNEGDGVPGPVGRQARVLERDLAAERVTDQRDLGAARGIVELGRRRVVKRSDIAVRSRIDVTRPFSIR